ncbi:hypothetical protein K438DRAFT_1604426, partial [Mycena galopus ATCC 62051]
IIIIFIPGGCTGVWQPLDVGIQCLLKLSIKRSAHRDVVDEALQQIKADTPPHAIKLDTTVRCLFWECTPLGGTIAVQILLAGLRNQGLYFLV